MDTHTNTTPAFPVKACIRTDGGSPSIVVSIDSKSRMILEQVHPRHRTHAFTTLTPNQILSLIAGLPGLMARVQSMAPNSELAATRISDAAKEFVERRSEHIDMINQLWEIYLERPIHNSRTRQFLMRAMAEHGDVPVMTLIDRALTRVQACDNTIDHDRNIGCYVMGTIRNMIAAGEMKAPETNNIVLLGARSQ